MAGYLINKKHCDDSVIEIKDLDGYTFRPKVSKKDYIKVSEVTIVDKQMIDKILSTKFDKSFKKVVNMASYVINDDDADDDAVRMVLDEVELVRQILLSRYQRFINHEKEQLFLKKLRLIENELRMKQVQIKQRALYLEQLAYEEMSRGRGR
jgi:hypothetical protein